MITLHRIDPARNMARFYSLDVQPTLFGEWSLVRQWGRINRRGRLAVELHASATDAAQAYERACRAKSNKGYRPSLR